MQRGFWPGHQIIDKDTKVMQCFAFFKQMVKNAQCNPCISSFLFNLVSLRAVVGAESKVSSWTSTERASRKEASMLSLSFHMETLKDRILDMKINMWDVFFTERAISQDRAALQPHRDKMRDIMITDLANELLLKVTKDKFYTRRRLSWAQWCAFAKDGTRWEWGYHS